MVITDKESEHLEGATPLNNEGTVFSRCVPEKIRPFHAKNRSGCYLIIISLLLNFALTVSLIVVSIIRLSSCIPDIEERKHNTVSSPTDAVTETKNQSCAPCEEDWIWYRGKCYYFSKESATWEDSQKFCISHNASLALIDTQDELDILLQFKGLHNHWIGLRRTDDNKAWTWTNGTLYGESLFKIIRSSQKDIEHVFLNYEGVKSQEGTITFKWICRKSS